MTKHSKTQVAISKAGITLFGLLKEASQTPQRDDKQEMFKLHENTLTVMIEDLLWWAKFHKEDTET